MQFPVDQADYIAFVLTGTSIGRASLQARPVGEVTQYLGSLLGTYRPGDVVRRSARDAASRQAIPDDIAEGIGTGPLCMQEAPRCDFFKTHAR